ncbi:MAG: hypothetical protein RLZZ244_2572 [Verrucomicrobiota bacterium]|jgi:deoxyribodipyrimidine photo-lyase
MTPPASLTRQDALLQWEAFLPKVPAYAARRNHVVPGHENVSRLSAALRFRTLLEDEVIAQTLSHHPFPVAEKWLQEVCWRRYWKGWMEMHPGVWHHWRNQTRAFPDSLPTATLARAKLVMAGQSGVPSMDRIARELVETGYLHNHARMWWASFWIHVEQLPWELGADFFYRHLLDADPASNTLSWRWVAGLQTPGKTYLVRLSNLEKYAPHYLGLHPSENARLADSDVAPLRGIESVDCPKIAPPEWPASLDACTGRRGLWLHSEDLVPEIGPLSSLASAAIAACLPEPGPGETDRPSARRIASLHTVLQDGLSRAGAYYGCHSEALHGADPALALSRWAKSQALREVVAMAPMVGPVADGLPRLRSLLEREQIRLTLLRRPSDTRAFSWATAGFFPFWQKMSRHLQSTEGGEAEPADAFFDGSVSERGASR